MSTVAPLRIVFRCDASAEIGTGHLMRCLVLADALAERDASSTFICRPFNTALLRLVEQRGHRLHCLAPPSGEGALEGYERWMGATAADDADETAAAIGDAPVDWLVADHYAVGAPWCLALRPSAGRIMVVDDLADRQHACDLLVDQNLGRSPGDYAPLVPPGAEILAGPRYALLAPRFAALRSASLERREGGALRQVLVTMGGADNDDATSWVLDALAAHCADAGLEVTVVMGAAAPHVKRVESRAATMPMPTRVLMGISDMATTMAACDLAIGAAGSTSWERCCLGVPSLMFVLAENQRSIAQALERAGAALLVDRAQPGAEGIFARHMRSLREQPHRLHALSAAAASVTDGMGAARVAQRMLELAGR